MDVDIRDSPIDTLSPSHDAEGSVTPPVPTKSRNLPLPPIEYLQNQRRVSITDPFLHVHLNPIGNGKNPNHKQPLLSKDSIISNPDQDFPSRTKSAPLVIRPSSPYVFGDATAKPARPTNQPADKNLRKLLHSTTPPAQDSPFQNTTTAPQQPTESYHRSVSGPPDSSNQLNGHDNRTSDPESKERVKHKFNDLEISDRLPNDFPPGFDWGMRRHSIATGGGAQPYQPRSRRDHMVRSKLKRKMSSDPQSAEDDEDFEPGLPPGTDVRLGSLSLYDRRESAYLTNANNTSPQPWDRRDSVVSTYSNLSSTGGYPSSAMSNESPKGLAPHPWLNLPPQPQANGFDRRMSVPEINHRGLSEHSFRRVRPRTDGREALTELDDHNELHSTQPSNSSPKGSMSTLAPPREAGAPYSRSPELRVSHKLAERKRRKEMKELFDELKEQLPADRSMKSSKWEILSKAIDHIVVLTTSLTESQRQIEALRVELEKTRDPHYSHISNPPIVHSQGPTILNYPTGARSGESSAGAPASTPPSANARPVTNPYTLPNTGPQPPPV